MRKTAVGYARVSTEKQSLDSQVSAIRAWCKANDYDLREVFTDFAVSGIVRASARPGLKALLAEISDGDALVVWHQDRLARSREALADIFAQLTNRDIELVSVSGGGETEIIAEFLAEMFNTLDLCEACWSKAALLMLSALRHNGRAVL